MFLVHKLYAYRFYKGPITYIVNMFLAHKLYKVKSLLWSSPLRYTPEMVVSTDLHPFIDFPSKDNLYSLLRFAS